MNEQIQTASNSQVIQAPGEPNPMQQLLGEDFSIEQPKRGEIRTGTVAAVTSHEILIDVGYKSEGVIAGRELEGIPPEIRSELKVGDAILTYVVTPEDRNGNLILSFSRAQAEQDWRDAESIYDQQETFEGLVAGFNKGGLIVKMGKVRGFVPASQLVSMHSRQEMLGDEEDEVLEELQPGERPQDRWQQLVGKKLRLKVIEIDRARNRLILSERAAMREWRKVQKEKLLSELHEGMQLKGTVISLADFGAFVDLGGADGLVHLSELSWKRVAHPREVLRVGQEVDVEVLSVDRDRKRIALSLKRTEQDPWGGVENHYKIGQLVEGVITKLVKFGAFARIVGDEDIEGLIHVSELSEGRVNHPKEVVHEGQTLTLRIIKIDAGRRRLGLSLKRVDSAEYAEEDWQRGLADAMQDIDELAAEAEDAEEAAYESVEQVAELAQEIGQVAEDVVEMAQPLEPAAVVNE
ncbi:MAG: S1 RNA-binding domain-containing protein [Thermoflexales bacterium]|nr:S1 RNA-binding domain-containing protein [Thermoflexales bacterium]